MKSIDSKLFSKNLIKKSEMSWVAGGVNSVEDLAGTGIFRDINPPKTRHTGDCVDPVVTSWSLDSTTKTCVRNENDYFIIGFLFKQKPYQKTIKT